MMVVLGSSVALFAAEAPEAAQAAVAAPSVAGFFGYAVIAIMIGLGIAAGFCGVGQGIAVNGALNGIARQPEATGKIQLNLIIGLAFIESLVLYTLFIGIVLLFVNPFLKYLVK
jgi:F-type H+-transporting ATPase subunit c